MKLEPNIAAILENPHFVSGSCQGVRCACGQDATHKVGEEIAHDDPSQGYRHNLTAYVCCQCFVNIVGDVATTCGVKRAELRRRDTRLERAVEALSVIEKTTSGVKSVRVINTLAADALAEIGGEK